MDRLPPLVKRRTSPSTGLSYICSGGISNAPRKLFICFHGWACAATDYASLLSALADLNKSSSENTLYIAVDFPGHGNSGKTICPQPTVPGFAAQANDLRREFSPPGELLDTVLIGHSMGCRMALEAFAQEKANVSGIVLIDGSWVGRNLEIHAAPVVDNREKEIRRISDRIGMYGPLTPESFKEEMQRRLREIDLEYEYELSRTYIQWDRERMEVVLGELGDKGLLVEVLVVQSTQGRGANRRPLKDGEEGPWVPFLREKVGSGRFQSVVLEGCGHWPHIDKVDEVAQIISGFARAAKG
jgi:pimeloyl-ACP methyl ester carboxylesterase